MPYSDQTEHKLVHRLRKSEAFIEDLSLIASQDQVLIGHILISKVALKDEDTEYELLSLAPVSVLPEYQGNSVGSQLIQTAHDKAVSLGYTSIVLVGHEDYYPRFGYKPAADFGIAFPFEAPSKNCMAIELVTGSLSNKSGTIVYPKEFGL